MSSDPESRAGDFVRLTAAALRKQAELVLAELQALEQAVAKRNAAGNPIHTDLTALVRHGMDCLTKLEWAAHAIVRYHALALDGWYRTPEPPV